MRAIACVLKEATADQWIEIASSHSKVEILKLVREHSLRPVKQKPGARTDTHAKTFRLQGGQIQPIHAAIEKAKNFNGTDNDSAALEAICRDYMETAVTLTTEVLLGMFVEHLNSLDKKAAGEVIETVRERVKHAL